MNIELTVEQQEARNKVFDILRHDPYVTLGGYAGTGKTTIIKSMVKDNTIVMAFTGKAAHVLRTKGVSAQTIHKTLYDLVVDDENKPILDEDGNLQWNLNTNIKADLIIVDEASMVPKWIFEDISKLKIPTVFVGDHGQLPPVGDSFNLMENPEITLEHIHRSSGEIPAFAEFLRMGGLAHKWQSQGSVHIGRFDTDQVDQVICGFNSTRKQINMSVTRTPKIRIGDKVIVLENSSQYKVFNGMQGVVSNLERQKLTLKIDGGTEYTFPIFLRNPETRNPNTIAVAHAYCITCHKAQGDEWDKVGVIEEQCDFWESHRWNYTAASRAKTEIFWTP